MFICLSRACRELLHSPVSQSVSPLRAHTSANEKCTGPMNFGWHNQKRSGIIISGLIRIGESTGSLPKSSGFIPLSAPVISLNFSNNRITREHFDGTYEGQYHVVNTEHIAVCVYVSLELIKVKIKVTWIYIDHIVLPANYTVPAFTS